VKLSRFFEEKQLLMGFCLGVASLWLGRYAINETSFPDHLVAPLLVPDSTGHADAIVVLGAGVIGECVPNLNSLWRVVAGARLLKDERAPLVAFSGGMAGGKCPVADAMMRFAQDLGVPERRIVAERHSSSTYENATASAPLLRAEGVQRILLVTDRLHMRRAKAVFEHSGFAVDPISVPIYQGHADNVSMLAAAFREAVALSYYSLRGWMQPTRTTQQLRATLPDGAPARAVRPAAAHPFGPIVILGASYAGNWPLTSVDNVPILNKGMAGQRTFQFVERFERDVTEQRPRAVLLWGFINNLFSSDNLEEASAAIRADYLKMIAAAKAAGIEPLLATEITVRRHEGWFDYARGRVARLTGRVSYQDRINEYVTQTNAWLAEISNSEGLRLLDFQHALADSSGRRRLEFAAEDGSHVSPAGYEALSAYARPILARHFMPVSTARQPHP
jgi:uncharacterized SAM-binding protein YcdF (DUF218 family)/lysophospholipase L1-like esterase